MTRQELAAKWDRDEIDNGECPACEGRGDVLIECEPITMEDLEHV